MKAICTVAVAVFALTFVLAPILPTAAAQEVKQEVKKVDYKAVKAKTPDNVAVIDVEYEAKPLGTIVLRFFPDVAPKHVANFTKLANEGFYSGTTFHRVIPGFMIQGGDPNTKDEDRNNDGYGGPGYTIDAEFSDLSHKPGILSMARGPKPNSAGSQFFICVADAPYLDGQYSVFGEVLQGMDVVNKIVDFPRDSKTNNPLKKVVMKKVSIQTYDTWKKSQQKQ